MRPRDFVPGVPAAGHLTRNGHWHSGPVATCHRCDLDRRCPSCGALTGRPCTEADGSKRYTVHPERVR